MPLVSLAMRPLLELWAEMRTVLELQAVENEKLLRLLEIEAECTHVHDAVFCVTLVVLVGAWLCSQAT